MYKQYFKGKGKYEERYVRFIEWCRKVNSIKTYNEVYENHHILPRSEFPEFVNIKEHPWNNIRLSARQHYLAHFILSFIYPKQLFAFNQMKRNAKSAILYAYKREHLSKLISELNTGRVMSDEFRKVNSEFHKGKVCVKDSTGKLIYTTVTDPRYISGELVFFRTGYKHKDSTIEKNEEKFYQR